MKNHLKQGALLMTKKSKKKRSRMETKSTTGSKAIKNKMTKAQLTAYLVDFVENQEDEIASRVSSKHMKKLVTATMDGLTDAIQRSIRPKGVGVFIMPKTFKVTLRTKKAIKKGTMVRSPATGGMVPSKGRPKSMRVKMNPLVNLKKAAAGEL